MTFRIKTAFVVAITVLVIMICNAAFDFSCIDGIVLYFLIYATQEINRINDRLDKMEGMKISKTYPRGETRREE